MVVRACFGGSLALPGENFPSLQDGAAGMLRSRLDMIQSEAVALGKTRPILRSVRILFPPGAGMIPGVMLS